MPIHRGPRLNDLIARLPRPIVLQANIYKTWPDLAAGIAISPTAWTELVAAASAPTQPFTVMLGSRAVSLSLDTNVLLGVGGAGSEVARAALAWCGGAQSPRVFEPFPAIAGGSRISLKAVAFNNDTASVITGLLPPPLPSAAVLQAARKENWQGAFTTPSLIGNATYNGDPGNVVISPSATAWAYGSWTEIFPGASVTDDAILTGMSLIIWSDPNPWQIAFGYGGVDGASNAPTATWGTFSLQGLGANYTPHFISLPVPVIWPSGTRLTARVATGIANSTTHMGALAQAVHGRWAYP